MDFNNTKVAFSSKNNRDLRNARLLFLSLQSNPLVATLKVLTNIALRLHLPLSWAVKPTLYRQFVGGESIEECSKTINFLKSYNIKSVLDFSKEGGTNYDDINLAYNETISSIEHASNNENIAFTVFKPTALVTGAILNKASSDISSLTITEMEEYERFKERVLELCKRAFISNVRILIDAEHYRYQGIIDKLAEEAMMLYNKKRVIVFHTLQMYRRDRLDYLLYLHDLSKRESYIPGIKFVRGAYMEQERREAISGGYPDPIHPDKESTDRCFNDGLRYVTDHIDSFELFCGTHNYESNLLLASLMDKRGLSRDDERVYFSQLYGMSDNISFTLAAEGYNVCKYLPYARVRDVLPYLLRRAEENRSIAGQTSRELDLINREIKRRREL
jgi:proline dehydrogenase